MTAKGKAARKAQSSRRTPQQQQFICDELVSIEHALLHHESLSQPRRLLLLRILRELLDGRDARIELGIPPKRGARPMKRGYHAWMAGHYWYLRTRQGEKDVAARNIVADAWGVSASQVWKIARPLKADWQRRFESGEFNNVTGTAADLIPHFKQLSANSR